LLDRICDQTTQLSDVDWLRVDELMREYDESLVRLACPPHGDVETAPAL
jgi:hypothetical protein